MMSRHKVLKLCILVISLTMFFYQLEKAASKLVDPPIADVTEHLKIEDIELPMITICPTQQFNITVLHNYGYDSYKSFLKGFKTAKLESSTDKNVSFWQIVDKALVYEMDDVDVKVENSNGTWTKSFFIKYGYCWDVINYDFSREIKITTKKLIEKTGDILVFLTDKHLKTRFDINLVSQRGPAMQIQKDKETNYYIEAEKLSYYNPNNVTCQDYDVMEYATCVDDRIQNYTTPLFKCNPPWISLINNCPNMDWQLARPNMSLTEIVKILISTTRFVTGT